MSRKFVIVQNSVKTTYLFRKDYITMLLDKGDVTLIAPNDSSVHLQKLRDLGVNVYSVPPMSSLLNKVIALMKMNYFVLTERMNNSVFICHFLITFIFCYVSLIPFNRKVIVYTEGLGTIFSQNKLARKILRFILTKNSSTRLFCNESEKELLGKVDDIVTGGIGVDFTKYEKHIERSTHDSSFSLLYVGRLIRDKGIEDVIFVFEELLARGCNVQLNLVGDIYNNNPSSLNSQDIEKLKIKHGSRINFVGFVEDVVPYYNIADVLLLPSKREGFPVVVMEASAMGVPSVGYSVPGVSDAIQEFSNGLLAKYQDQTELVTITQSLLSKEVLLNYETSCVEYAVKNFSRSLKSEELVKIILGTTR